MRRLRLTEKGEKAYHNHMRYHALLNSMVEGELRAVSEHDVHSNAWALLKDAPIVLDMGVSLSLGWHKELVKQDGAFVKGFDRSSRKPEAGA